MLHYNLLNKAHLKLIWIGKEKKNKLFCLHSLVNPSTSQDPRCFQQTAREITNVKMAAYSHRMHTKATVIDGINAVATPPPLPKKKKLASAMDNCFGVIRPHQHGIANTWTRGSHRKNNKWYDNGSLVGCGRKCVSLQPKNVHRETTGLLLNAGVALDSTSL